MATDARPDPDRRRLRAGVLIVAALAVVGGVAVAATAGGGDQGPPDDDEVGSPTTEASPGPTTESSSVSPTTTPATTETAATPTTTTSTSTAPAAPVYFVDNTHRDASDSNEGTSEEAPWRTIVHAAATVRAGETVYVKAGTYDDGAVELENSGTPGAPIVLAAYPGHERQPTIVNAGFMSVGNSHVELSGFTIRRSPDTGIRFEGPEDPYAPPATDIVIADNHTYDTCSSGISIWGVDWGEDPGDYDNIRDVVIEDNLLELGTNGCKDEIITVANGAVNVDVRRNTIRVGDPNMEGGDEGIDFKEGVRDSRIYGNEIYDLSDKAIYIDGGSADADSTRYANDDPFVRNISIFDNHMYDLPSAGVSIVTEGKGDVDGIYVFNNVVHDVDGDGFLVYQHPGERSGGGSVRNVHIVNNTVYNSGLRHSGHGGIRVNHPTATGIVVRNNIAWNNNGFDIRGEGETTIDHNLCRESALCETSDDPGFVDTEGRDLHLRPDSAAINRGTAELAPDTDKDGRIRPNGDAIDLGAYEPA